MTRAEMDAALEDMRAYRIRQAEWLGLDPEEVTNLSDEPASGWLKVTWESISQAQPQRGRVIEWGGRNDGDDSPTIFRYVAVLDLDEQVAMRQTVGPKPKMPLDGLRPEDFGLPRGRDDGEHP